jgi:hypothetical protein
MDSKPIRSDGIRSTTIDSQPDTNPKQPTKKRIPAKGSNFTVDTTKTRVVSKQEKLDTKKRTFRKFSEYVKSFKENTSTNVKRFVAGALMLVPVVGCAIVALYLLESRKIDKTPTVNDTNILGNNSGTEDKRGLLGEKLVGSSNGNLDRETSSGLFYDVYSELLKSHPELSDAEKETKLKELIELSENILPICVDLINQGTDDPDKITDALIGVIPDDIEGKKLEEIDKLAKDTISESGVYTTKL